MARTLLQFLAISMFTLVTWAQEAPEPPEPPMTPQQEAPHRVVKNRRVHVDAPSASYLGVDPRDVGSGERGVEVMMVDRDSPAGKAGLREHDVIVGFNGKQVVNVEQLRRLLRDSAPGKTVALAINRGGQAMTLKATLAKRPEQWMAMPPIPPIPSMPSIDVDVPQIIVLQSSARNGAVVEDLTPQLADFFGVKNGQGVLVRSVDRGSPAASAGLKAGDVIMKVGNQPVTCSSDFRRMMHDQSGSVPLAVFRDKREQSVTIKLPDKSSDSSLHIEMPDFEREMQQLRAEMERVRPEIAKEVEIARADLQQEWLAHRGEINQAMELRREDWERAQREARKAIEEALKELNTM